MLIHEHHTDILEQENPKEIKAFIYILLQYIGVLHQQSASWRVTFACTLESCSKRLSWVASAGFKT